jgi:uncharacterized membrane protein (DUF485 family)
MYPTSGFAQVPKQENTVFLFGILPFSLFILSLILSLIYLNKDELDERKVLGFFAWLSSVLNSLYGLAWSYYLIKGVYSIFLGAPIFSNVSIVFLCFFAIGGFLPLYYMFKTAKYPKILKSFNTD